MIRRSLALAFSDKVAAVVINLVTMAVVSRLLTPAEVGLFLVSSAVVILVESFRDFGVAACIVQSRALTRPFLQTAATVITLLSVMLGAILVLMSPVIASLYGDPALGELVGIAAAGFLFAPFSNPRLALLRREMRFGILAVLGIFAALGSSGVTIVLAVNGVGAASLVYGSLVSAAVLACGAMAVRPEWAIFRPRLSEWRAVLPFGAWSTLVTVLGLLTDSLPRLILGRVLGFANVGLFGRSLSIIQLPERMLLSAVQPVVLPAMSDLARKEQSIKAPYLTGLSIITAVQWPALAVFALLAEPVVTLLLGNQWMDVVWLVRIMAFAAFTVTPVYLTFPVLVSLGRVRDMAMGSLIGLPPTMIIMFTASQFGLEAFAWSMWLTMPLQTAVMLVIVRRHVPFDWIDLARLAYVSLRITACTSILPALMIFVFGSALSVPLAIVAGFGATIGWLIGLRVTDHMLIDEIGRATLTARRKLGWLDAPA